MRTTVRKSAMTFAALGALGLGGAALAGAADNKTKSSSGTNSSQTRPGHPEQEALASDVAAKVEAAALAKVPGATVLRTEAGGPYGSAYHAHVKKADGTLAVVLVDKDFAATSVQTDRGRGPGGRRDGHHGRGPGGPGHGETALTGDTKSKVEAAALAKLPGATIIRSETNNDSTAPYEAHVRKSDGTEAEVLVSKTFAVVQVNERPARP